MYRRCRYQCKLYVHLPKSTKWRLVCASTLFPHTYDIGIIEQKYIFPTNRWRSWLDISSFWTYCVQKYDRFVFSWFFIGALQQNLNHDKIFLIRDLTMKQKYFVLFLSSFTCFLVRPLRRQKCFVWMFFNENLRSKHVFEL